MDDPDVAAMAARIWLAAGVASVQSVSPAWGLAAAAVEPVLGTALERWQRVQAERSARLLGAAADAANSTPHQVVSLLLEDEETLVLLAQALNSAGRTALEAKIAAMGKSLGSLAADRALVDPESIWMRILGDIEPPHVRVMQYLLREDPQQPGHAMLARPHDLSPITGSDSIGFVILQTLINHGLAQEVDKNRLGPQTRARWGITAGSAYPAWYMRGRLTEECIERLGLAAGGGHSPDSEM